MNRKLVNAVLFDLDGTLADTAPDLLAALDGIRARLGLEPLDHEALRHLVALGAAGLLDAGLPELSAEHRESVRDEFLESYRARCWHHSRPFPGIQELLDNLDARAIPWGVVTNKLESLARPVLEQAGWLTRAVCLVAGDTASAPKPSPKPVLAACAAMGVSPGHVLLVGDDRRDVDAGRAAGTTTAVALWGYLPLNDDPISWNADLYLESPVRLREFTDSVTGEALR